MTSNQHCAIEPNSPEWSLIQISIVGSRLSVFAVDDVAGPGVQEKPERLTIVDADVKINVIVEDSKRDVQGARA